MFATNVTAIAMNNLIVRDAAMTSLHFDAAFTIASR
jgi:hypothetical protein